MAFERLKEDTDNIQEEMQALLKANVAYYKLWGFKVAMKSTTMVLKFTLIVISLIMVILFCSIAGAFALGQYLDSYALGFLIMGGVYLLLTGLLFTIRERFFEGSVLEKFSEIFFND